MRARAIAFGLLLVLGCGDPGEQHRPPAEYRPVRLLSQVGVAQLAWTEVPAPVTQGLQRDAHGRLVIRERLEADPRWRQVRPDRAHDLGIRERALTAWHLPLELSSDASAGIRLRGPDRDLAAWQRGAQPPSRLSWFYYPAGFLPRGFYLALDAVEDPRRMSFVYEVPATGPVEVQEQVRIRASIDPADLLARRSLADTTRLALFLPAGLAVSFPVTIPDDATLTLGVGRESRGSGAEAPTVVSISISRTGGRVPLLEERVELGSATAPPDAWRDVRVGLGSLAGEAVTIRFEAQGELERTGFHFVSDPVISGPSPRGVPNLLLIVIDGLRSDRVSSTVGGVALTPRLEELAARGVRFHSVRAAAPWTRPSIASMFTGLPPTRHGVERERHRDRLSENIPSLARVLREAGYATAAISANLHLSPAFGLQQGFASVRCHYEDAREINGEALRWLDARPSGPFFLFLFYMDTHSPFRHRPEIDFSSRFTAEAREPNELGPEARRKREGAADPSREEIAKLEALYDENVRYVDARLGELLRALDERGLSADTVVVVTADHGEAFGEHGDFFHGWNLFEELLQVPLVAAGPGVPSDTSRHDPVSLLDLPGMLAGAMGLPRDSLWGPGTAALDDRAPDPDGKAAIYSETRFRSVDLAAVVHDTDKLILDRATGRIQLFDLALDPAERKDRSRQQPDRAAVLERQLRVWLVDQARMRVSSREDGPAPALDAATEEELRALGYVP